MTEEDGSSALTLDLKWNNIRSIWCKIIANQVLVNLTVNGAITTATTALV